MAGKNWRNSLLVAAAAAMLAGCLPEEAQLGRNGAPAGPSESNSAPVIGGTPAGQVVAGFTYLFQPFAADSDGDALSFSALGLPQWATISPQTGLVSGTPAADLAGTTSTIVVRVTDGHATASLPAFTLSVMPGTGTPPPGPGTPTNTAPTISGTPSVSVLAGTSYNFTPVVTDLDNDSLSFSISQGSLPSWATFSIVNGSLSGTPGAGHVGTYPNIVITVTDGSASASLPAFTLTVSAPPQASGSAVLSWTTPLQYTDGTLLPLDVLIGYRVYHGPNAASLSVYHDISSANTTSYEVRDLGPGEHCFAVTAVTILNLESQLSGVGCKQI